MNKAKTAIFRSLPNMAWLIERQPYIYILLIGLFFLSLSYFLGFPRIAWSDEIYYVVVARNIAEHATLNTTLYQTEAILRGGYPLRDVHIAGYMLIMSLPIMLFGHADWVMLLPSQLAFLTSGLLVFWAGKRIFSPPAGFGAAISFYIFPLFFHYSNTAMSELVLTLAAIIFFCVWISALEKPAFFKAIVLAILLIAGMLLRETFLLFLPFALFAVIRFPKEGRKLALIGFLGLFILMSVSIVYPISMNRAYYPTTYYQTLSTRDPMLIFANLAANFKLQISRYLFSFDKFPEDQILKLQSVLFLFAVVASVFLKNRQRITALFYALSYLGILLSTCIFNSASGWRGLRMMLMTIPVGLIVTVGALLQIRNKWLKTSLYCGMLIVFAFYTWHGNNNLVKERIEFNDKELPETATFHQLLDPYHPHLILAQKPWGYALDRFPVNVIWEMPESMDELTALQKIVRSDVIVARSAGEKDKMLKTLNLDCAVPCYRMLDEAPFNNNYFIIKSGLFKQPLMADLNSDLRLLGVDTTPLAYAGKHLPLTLVWQARRDISVDYAVAVRILDAHDREAQYWLGKPVLSSLSTNKWRKDEVVPDTWDISLDPAVASGKYKLEVEVYDSSTQQSKGRFTLGELEVLPGKK